MNFEPGMTFTLPLWSRWPEEALRSEYQKSPTTFDLGMRQRPHTGGSKPFEKGLTKMLLRGVRVSDLVGFATPRYGGFDPAGERRRGNALMTIAEGPAEGRVIVEARLWANEAARDSTVYTYTAKQIALAHQRQRYKALIVETVALQGMMLDMVRSIDKTIPVEGFQTGVNKHDEDFGTGGLAVELEGGLWTLCMDDPYDTSTPLIDHRLDCDCAYCELIRDLMDYPDPRRKYDLLMALLFAREAYRRNARRPPQLFIV